MSSAPAKKITIPTQVREKSGSQPFTSSQFITKKRPYSQKYTESSQNGISGNLEDVTFLRLPEVKAITGLSKSSLARTHQRKEFPCACSAWSARRRVGQIRGQAVGCRARPCVTVCRLIPPRVLTRPMFLPDSRVWIQEVRPALHHDAPLWIVESLVISRLPHHSSAA